MVTVYSVSSSWAQCTDDVFELILSALDTRSAAAANLVRSVPPCSLQLYLWERILPGAVHGLHGLLAMHGQQ